MSTERMIFHPEDVIYGFYNFWRVLKVSPGGMLTVIPLMYEQEIFTQEPYWYIRKKLLSPHTPVRDQPTRELRRERNSSKYTNRKLSETSSSVLLYDPEKDYLIRSMF